AYLVAGPGQNVDVPRIRSRIADRLPEYMVPSAFVVLDALPVTSNGKLDRAALPAPDYASAAAGKPPASETERRVARLFEEVLGLEARAVSADSDFFALGGHSLLAARVMARVREEW